jgi:hypothetical protein
MEVKRLGTVDIIGTTILTAKSISAEYAMNSEIGDWCPYLPWTIRFYR